MRSICRTVYGSALQVARSLSIPHVIPNNATLNQYVLDINQYGMTADVTSIQPRLVTPNVAVYSLQSYVDIDDTPNMRTQYLAIGNRGHRNFTAADQNSPPYTGPIPHMARHSGLYGQVPFVMRLPSNDLTASERSNYRHRAWILVNGVRYIAYFLRRITPTNQTVDMVYNTVVNGVVTEQQFLPTSNDLRNPTAPGNPGAPIVTTGDFLSTSALLNIIFTPAEISELLNVSRILFNNEEQAIISEFALCHGVDKNSYHSFNGTTIDTATVIQEACGVQVSTFLTAYYPLVYSNNGLTVTLNLGAVEPLYGVAV